MLKLTLFGSFLAAVAPFASIQPDAKVAALPVSTPIELFNEYWYKSQAEVSCYTLSQESFGELHYGDAVLVYTPEKISRSKQYKPDNSENSTKDQVDVLKVNAIRKFTTGMYDFSLMNTVFTPTDLTKDPHSLKLTSSIQDWCGQVFYQLNWRANNYEAKSFSYLDGDDSKSSEVNTHMIEDELWNLIRINPSSIATRKVMMLPSVWFLNMKRKEMKPLEAGIINSEIDDKVSQIEVVYPTIQRVLRIQYETKFPHKILGWEEKNGKDPMTKAKLKTTVQTPYWLQNKVSDKPSRDKLGLMY